MDLPDCPMYALLQALHFNLYIPLGLFWAGFSLNCWYVVFVARKVILRLDCLKSLVTFPTQSKEKTESQKTAATTKTSNLNSST
jgi:hypothetical protein